MDSFFMPHGHCYLWQPGLVWLQVITNGLIGLAYVAIAGMLYYLVRRGQYVPFRGMALAFGVFIVSCGMTHFLDVYVIWEPIYWTDGIVRAITAAASVGTALMLPPLIPRAIALARGAKAAHERGIELETALLDLETAYERAKDLERMKTEFFANVSHELRTPLALILGPVERMLASGKLDESARGDAELIQRNARTLLKHVNDLLDVSRFEAGKLEARYMKTDAARLAREVAANFEGIATERGMKLVVDVPESLEADIDPDKVQRVLLNLLSNAFKFTPAGGTVRLTVRNGDQLVVEIADSGPGIPVRHRRRVFERFGQLDTSATRRFGGTGLGLAIAKDFAEVHGGTIEVHDAPEGGALMRVTLPRRAPAGATVHAEPTEEDRARDDAAHAAIDELASRVHALDEATGGDRPLVLVVEDNPDMNRFVSETLAADYRVEHALDGKTGLDKTVELRPDLVVSDIMMPEMSGDQLVREIRRRSELDAIPILLLTAKADDELRVALLRDGAQDYVMKPFDTSELVARVKNLVTMKRARDVLERTIEMQTDDLELLAQEVSDRKRELEATLGSMRVAKEQAERASQLKSEFLGMVSHELRTPLSTLRLQLERLRLDESELDAEKRRLVERMFAQTNRLHELIEGLLEYARLQAGRLPVELSPFDVKELVTETVDEVRPQAAKKGIAVRAEVEPGASFESDRRLLRLILLNLLGNAVKFTEKGKVEVRARRVGEGLSLLVADTGPGIAAEDRARIFEPFEQLTAPHKKHVEGVGIGLALVRDLSQALGGTVTVEAAPEHGTIFTVRLPSPKMVAEASAT